jgi:Anti-sigma-K factor rskA, C-terminal
VTDGDEQRIAYLAGEAVPSLPAQERAELDELRALLSSADTWAEPGPDLEDQIVAAIQHEAAAGDPAQTTSPEPAASRAWRFPRLTLRRPIYAFGGLAAAAAAVVAIVIATNTTSPAPLRFAMVVSGTPLAPGAHGSATLTKTVSGWKIELNATGLPHLENGRYYQAWLKNAAGILVPVGTFNDARHVTLWSGAPVTKFRSFTVTIQLQNGNPKSSGLRVLTGTAHQLH